MLMIFMRVLIIYPIVVFGIRLMGKRQIGELQPTELAVTLLISNIATLPLEDQNLPVLTGVLPMLMLIAFEVLLSFGVLRSRKLRHMLAGAPQTVIRSGRINQKVMRALRFTLDDLMTALRSSGVFDIAEVQTAIVETNGTVSVRQNAQERTVTCADLQLRPEDDDPPEVLIADGCISAAGLQAAGWTASQLNGVLRQKQLKPEDIYLLTADSSGLRTLIRKETGT